MQYIISISLSRLELMRVNPANKAQKYSTSKCELLSMEMSRDHPGEITPECHLPFSSNEAPSSENLHLCKFHTK